MGVHTVSGEGQRVIIMPQELGKDIARIVRFSSLPGIDPILLCSRYAATIKFLMLPKLRCPQQVLYGIVQNIASQFPDDTRARYQHAAANFRIPDWDWAAQPPNSDTYFPNSVGSPNINVISPQSNGQTVQIPNPLYSTTFTPLNPVKGDFTTIDGTPVRYKALQETMILI